MLQDCLIEAANEIRGGSKKMYRIMAAGGVDRRGIRERITGALGGIALAGAALAPIPAAAPGDRVSPPVLTCGDANQGSLKIQVCAGKAGAPAGFVLNWLEVDPSVLSPLTTEGQCIARYFREKYRLADGACATVTIGELVAQEANYSNCLQALTCGTNYKFTGFARATSTLRRGPLAGPIYCSTDPCTPNDTCTLTQGYWKTHGPVPVGGNKNEWPVSSLTLGNIVYTDQQALAILRKAPGGNGLITLAHQLIAAKLNVANGADATAVSAAIAAADSLIGARLIPPAGGGFLAPSVTSTLVNTLTQYNEGGIGPGHCGSKSTQDPS
jgi:hypothetical protein